MTTSAFILMFYIWNPAGSGAAITFAEFSSQEKCEAAGQAAKDKFDAILSTATWLCVPK